jgi:NADPH:quinone reductase-like Zn-dependent oxidoreductase
MTKAMRIHEYGGPEVLRWEDVELGAPGAGEVLVRHGAVGLNFIDVYMRTGAYPQPALPAGIGLEAAGLAEALGPGVTDLALGDRVAYAAPPPGAYAEARLMPAAKLVKIPEGVTDNQAAAMMLKGMTAEYLLHRTYAVKPGDTILFHAAAGGVGLIACQWARHLGATVIGTVSTAEKAALAAAHGCDHPIIVGPDGFTEQVRELTGGAGVRVVYDSIGKDSFEGSLDCLAPRGMMVSFGQSSGPVPDFNIAGLASRGSLFLTRPSVMTYTAGREDLEASAAALFDVVAAGHVRIEINQTYALADAVQAHTDLEARKTTGSTVLLPG